MCTLWQNEVCSALHCCEEAALHFLRDLIHPLLFLAGEVELMDTVLMLMNAIENFTLAGGFFQSSAGQRRILLGMQATIEALAAKFFIAE